ncbi:MAG: glycosyltransferase family 4 protein [Acidimicrobiales bacterium]
MTGLRITLVEFGPAGGLFQFSHQLGSALAGRGHQVELLTGPRPELGSAGPSFVVRPILPTWHPSARPEPWLWRKLRRVARAARYVAGWVLIARHVRATRPDVVQWSSWRFAMDGLFAALIARAGWAGASVDLCHEPIPLEEQHGSGSMYREGFLLQKGLSMGYRSMDSVLTLGASSQATLRAAFGGIARSDIVAHGDEQALRGEATPTAPSACGPTVMLFGSLSAYKGIDTLLDAWPLVRQSVADARLVLVGPPSADLDLRQVVTRAGTDNGIDVRPGYVPIGQVGPLFSSARVVAAPYRRSNASGSVRLAQTFERPVVVTDVGDLTQSVADGVSGLVVALDDAGALADALIRLLRHPELADRLGRAGYDHLRATASWPVVAEGFERIYREVLDARRSGTADRKPGSGLAPQ